MSGGPAQPALDMTLDDLIKQNQKTGGGVGRGSGRGVAGFGPGPSRRFPNRAPNRVTPYSAPKAPEAVWSHDMFASDQAMAYAAQIGAARASSIETGTKLYLSNLDYGVTNEDIKELFAEVGDLKRYTIHYDKSGRSKGTAEVVFSRRQDALAAVKRYNGVQLDGKPMKIEIVGTNIVTPTTALPLPLPLPPPIIRVPIVVNGAFGGVPNGVPISVQGRGRGFGRTRGGGGGGGGGGGRGRGRGFGRGRGRGRDNVERVSADDLDADLDKYHKAAMETN